MFFIFILDLITIFFSLLYLKITYFNPPVFVRKGSDGKAQLVLLDHGLYDTIKGDHRRALCQLYKAIIMNDEDAMDSYSQKLGVEG